MQNTYNQPMVGAAGGRERAARTVMEPSPDELVGVLSMYCFFLRSADACSTIELALCGQNICEQ